MANAREIQSRMKSIQDTMKITNAMYTISSSKLKKARKMLEATEPYFYTLQTAIQRIIRHVPDIEHPFFVSGTEADTMGKVGYIIVTADKGMAGAYNHNVIKLAQVQLDKTAQPMVFVLGELGRQYFAKKKVHVDLDFHFIVQNPTISRARTISEEILDVYKREKLDAVYLIYTRMINSMNADAEMLQVLPLKKETFKVQLPLGVPLEEIVMSPSAEVLLDNIVPDYVTGIIYGALVESFSSEQNSRMMAMEAATNSAREILRALQIDYNRVRQAAITQEITEVVSGAKAQKAKKKR